MGFAGGALGLLQYAWLSSHMVEALCIILTKMIPHFNLKSPKVRWHFDCCFDWVNTNNISGSQENEYSHIFPRPTIADMKGSRISLCFLKLVQGATLNLPLAVHMPNQKRTTIQRQWTKMCRRPRK